MSLMQEHENLKLLTAAVDAFNQVATPKITLGPRDERGERWRNAVLDFRVTLNHPFDSVRLGDLWFGDTWYDVVVTPPQSEGDCAVWRIRTLLGEVQQNFGSKLPLLDVQDWAFRTKLLVRDSGISVWGRLVDSPRPAVAVYGVETSVAWSNVTDAMLRTTLKRLSAMAKTMASSAGGPPSEYWDAEKGAAIAGAKK